MDNGLLKKLLKKIRFNESTISTILGALVIIVVGALIVNYFRGVEEPEGEVSVEPEEIKLVEEGGELVPDELPATHKVLPDEHLWSIAEKYYGSGYNWVNIAQENGLTNPNHLEVDQELAIPRAAVIEPIEASETSKVIEITVFGPTIANGSYTTVEGDHLWGIAVRAYGDGYKWSEIASANNLPNPDIIEPGAVLTLPR